MATSISKLTLTFYKAAPDVGKPESDLASSFGKKHKLTRAFHLYDWLHNAGGNAPWCTAATVTMFILLHAMCYIGSVHLLHVFSVAEQLLPSVKGCL